MDNRDNITNIVENFFYAMPVIHKKLMKIDPPDIDCGIRISRQHIGIMAVLKENKYSISEIAKPFFISNPQMTYLIGQMVGAGLVERTKQAQDRRVIKIGLTPKGEQVFNQCDEYLKDNVRQMLGDLDEKELRELADSLTILRRIGPKLGN
jgi:DNA-binding MarR family transcriptional regulator